MDGPTRERGIPLSGSLSLEDVVLYIGHMYREFDMLIMC
jgi:hypothetical protein